MGILENSLIINPKKSNKNMKKYKRNMTILFMIIIVFAISKIIGSIIFLAWLCVIGYIYLVRIKPGTGEKVDYVATRKINDDDNLLAEARAFGKIPMYYFHAQILNRNFNSENSTYIYTIEFWEFRETKQKELSTQ